MCNWLHHWYRPDRHSAEKLASEMLLLLESGWRNDGDDRAGTWARPDTVDDALDPVRSAVNRAKSTLDALSIELTRAQDRLQDGVAKGRRQ
jgi:hypothetical protein